MDLTKSETNGYKAEGDPGEPSTGTPRLSVNDTEAKIFASFCFGKRVLEIGTGLGVATRAVASACDRLVTIDIDPWVAENVFPSLRTDYKEEHVTTLTAMPGRGLPFDVAIIDGSHRYNDVMNDIQAACARLVQGGLILFHDYHIADVRLAINDACNMQGMITEHVYIKTYAGIAMAWSV